MENRIIHITVNQKQHDVLLPPNVTLLRALRDVLGYMDVKNGCESGDCGACTVILDGKAVNSCMVLAWQADGKEVITCTGLGTINNPHPIQEAFADTGGAQCGYCTPGMIMTTKTLLEHKPEPSEEEIRWALSGNLCRCTGYGQIIEAVKDAANRLSKKR